MRGLILILFFLSTVCTGKSISIVPELSVPSPQDSWFGKDKAMHCISSFLLVGGTSYYLKTRQDYSPDYSRQAAVSFTISLGLGKEVRDLFSRRGQFSLKDMAADGAGIVLALFLVEWW